MIVATFLCNFVGDGLDCSLCYTVLKFVPSSVDTF